MFDPVNGVDGLEAWVARELRRPVATDPARKARIMELVRASGTPMRRARRRAPGRGARAGWASPLVGFALAASICGLVTAGALRPLVLEQRDGPAVAAAVALGDTVRLVRSMLAVPASSPLVVPARLTRWNANTTSVAAADASGVSMVTVALAPAGHRVGRESTRRRAEPPTLRLPRAGGAANSADSLAPASDTSS